MKVKMVLLKRLIKVLATLYLGFVLIGTLLPYALPKKVSDAYKEAFKKRDFQGSISPDRVALVETPHDSFQRRLQLVASAKERLDIVYHTIRPGETTDHFFAQVLEAADRGVQVRILIDGKVGSMSTGEKKKLSYALASHPNIEYRFYNKMTPFNPWTWNTLLHDKFIKVDNTYLLTGGRNIGDVYFDPPGYTGRLSNDRDLLVYNAQAVGEDSVLGEVERYMELLWNQKESVPAFKNLSQEKQDIGALKKKEVALSLAALKKAEPTLFMPLSPEEMSRLTVETNGIHMLSNPVHTLKKEPWVGYALAQLALQAKESVIIQTPYATGNKDSLKVLKQIGDKNIDFQMLTNSIGVTPNFPAFSNYYSQRKKFLATGVELYEFQNPVASLHCKSYLFDSRLSVVGSFNLDDRSFYIDTESIFVVDSVVFHKILGDTIQEQQNHALVVGKDNHYLPHPTVTEAPASLVKQGGMWVVSIFSRLFQFLI